MASKLARWEGGPNGDHLMVWGAGASAWARWCLCCQVQRTSDQRPIKPTGKCNRSCLARVKAIAALVEAEGK